ncbi:MAG: hypothetical protein BWK79_14140 [Beggiatoa sp. IS2]|nr:MAG: hypothetical protein BWK79_14140 [Beggiatoa sp. IS2]
MKKSFLKTMLYLAIFSKLFLTSSAIAENSTVAQPTCLTGVVSWFDQQNGFGFITPQNGGAEIFVHFSTIVGKGDNKVLFSGQVVDFNMVYDDAIGRNRTIWVMPRRTAR